MTFPEKSQLQQKKLLETVQNACKIVDIHFFEKSLPVVRSLKYSLGWMQWFENIFENLDESSFQEHLASI